MVKVQEFLLDLLDRSMKSDASDVLPSGLRIAVRECAGRVDYYDCNVRGASAGTMIERGSFDCGIRWGGHVDGFNDRHGA